MARLRGDVQRRDVVGKSDLRETSAPEPPSGPRSGAAAGAPSGAHVLAVASTSGVRPGAFSAFTSAPRLSSSSATSTRFSPAAQWRGVPISELAPTVRLAPWSRRKVMISRSLLPQAIWDGRAVVMGSVDVGALADEVLHSLERVAHAGVREGSITHFIDRFQLGREPSNSVPTHSGYSWRIHSQIST